MEFKEVLDTPMQENDAGASTVGEYLILLLEMVWNKGEAFDGKRPFGNSAWEYEIYEALKEAGLIKDANTYQANSLVANAIKSLYQAPNNG
jgi:hypothetical protein